MMQEINLLKQLERALQFEGVSFLPDLPADWVRPTLAEADFSVPLEVGESRVSTAFEIGSHPKVTLEELRTRAMTCTSCRLAECRKNVAFDAGNADRPLICFVGEGPGADEDEQGLPFVGKAGQLLTQAIEKGLCVPRSSVYICNVIKCRPPENRSPLPDEVSACMPFLEQQLRLVRPKVIVSLGKVALDALLPESLEGSGKKRLGISAMRGQWMEWQGIALMPTFHPAYLLRNTDKKREFWEDLKSVMSHLGLPGRSNS